MSTYRAPVEDMSFIIDEVLEVEKHLGQLPRFEGLGVGPELTTALLDEAAKLAGDVLAPLRRVGDLEPATCSDGKVTLRAQFLDSPMRKREQKEGKMIFSEFGTLAPGVKRLRTKNQPSVNVIHWDGRLLGLSARQVTIEEIAKPKPVSL